MIRMINKLTKTEMWVHESRAEAYKAAGHKPAAPTSAEEAKEIITEELPEEEPEEKPVKKKGKK